MTAGQLEAIRAWINARGSTCPGQPPHTVNILDLSATPTTDNPNGYDIGCHRHTTKPTGTEPGNQ